MKVRATARGYVGGSFRYPGDIFEVDEKAFSGKWMEEVAPTHKPKPAADLEEDQHAATHRGGGYWDVTNAKGEIVEGGESLKKAPAKALAKKLNAGG